MSFRRFDFSSCEQEPIRRLGLIQSYGCLLVIDPSSDHVLDASANAQAMLRLSATPLGRPVRSLFPQWRSDAITAVRPVDWPFGPYAPIEGFRALAHRTADAIALEFIPARIEPAHPAAPFSGFSDPLNLFRCANEAAEAISAEAEFDRVMVYQFDRDACGEVIAEVRRPELVPYLGLHFPSADIPAQARALFAEIDVRLIQDISAPPAPLLAGGPSPDLSYAVLRQPSSMHIEYLQNMGVRATLTLPVVLEGRLWGLIACHHRDAKLVPWETQGAAAAIAGAFRDVVREAERRREERGRSHAAAFQAVWAKRDGADNALADRLLSGRDGIAAAAGADGAAIVSNGVAVALGATPGPNWIDAFLKTPAAANAQAGAPLAFHRRPDVAPQEESEAIAGVLAVKLIEPACWLFAFRRPILQEVYWGGDPTMPGTVDPETGRASPRKSFAVWRELARDASRPWEDYEISAFKAIAHAIDRRGAVTAEFGEVLAGQFGAISRVLGDDDAVRTMLLGLLPEGAAVLLARGRTPDGAILHASRSFSETFGLDSSALVGRAVASLAERTRLPADVLFGANPEEREVETWSPQAGMRRLRIRRERVGYVRCNAAMNEIWALTLSDVTGAARTIEALQASMRQALAAQETAGAVMRNMSHEMRTPLNAIIANAEMIKTELMGPVGDHAYREAAEDIAAAGAHLLQVVSNTLEMARLQSAQAVLAETIVDLIEPIEQAVRLSHALAAEKQIRVEWDGAALGGWLVDATAVRQMMLNLISNALKFTPRNGLVRVSASINSLGEAVLQVRDTGVGIAPQDLPRLFQPFSQVDPSIDRLYGGAGLGLALVKALISLHGGAVTVDSERGRGSTFSLTLPAWRRRGLVAACAS